jgi:hypothetical protein
MDNPFIFERPVEPNRFIGRSKVIRRLWSTFARNGSLVVSGQPRIGKTSLLKKLLFDWEVQAKNETELPTPILISQNFLQPEPSPKAFWSFVTSEISRILKIESQDEIADNIGMVERFFDTLEKNNKKFILMLDGIGGLIDNPKFSVEFWGSMRSLISRRKSISMILFSRLESHQIQEQIEMGRTIHGSPFLNFASELVIPPFSEKETSELLESYTSTHDSLFTPKDKRMIWTLSGGYPFLVQLTASTIWDFRLHGESISIDNYNDVKNTIVEFASPHFWDVWRYLTPTAQVIGLMVALREIAIYQKFDTKYLDEAIQTCQSELYSLENIGLLRVENQKPILASLAFGIWIFRTKIGAGLDIPEPEQWLRENRQVFGNITQKQIDNFSQSVGKIYAELRESIIDLGEGLAKARLGI